MEPLCDGELSAAVDPNNPTAIAAAIQVLLENGAPDSDPVRLRSEAVRRFGFESFKVKVEQVINAS